MKKWVSALIACSMAVATVGCSSTNTVQPGGEVANKQTETKDSSSTQTSSQPTTSKETVTLRVWGGVPEEAGPQASVDLFNEQFKDKGIQAEYIRFVNDDTGNLKLETTLLGGEGIDIYISYGKSQLAKRMEGNMALDLTPYMERDGFDVTGIFGDIVESYTLEDKYYGIPTKLDQYGILINKDMFDAAGIAVPTQWTYSEFRDIAKQLTSGEGLDKTYGMFLNTQQDILGPFTYFMTQSTGGDWMYTADGSASNFEDPLIKETLQLVYDMMNVDQSVPSHVDSVTQKLTQESLFLSGKAAMSIGPWIIRNIKDTTNYPHDFVTALAPYPLADSGEQVYNQGGVGDIISINPKSANIEAAWEYVKWYATEGMLPVSAGGRIPLANTYVSEDVTAAILTNAEHLFDEQSLTDVMVTPKGNYALQMITDRVNEITQVFKEEVEAVLSDRKTVDAATADAKNRADKILAE